MTSIEVRSSGWGPREAQGWDYTPEHRPLRDGRVVSYWVRCVALTWPRDGVAIIIRRES